MAKTFVSLAIGCVGKICGVGNSGLCYYIVGEFIPETLTSVCLPVVANQIHWVLLQSLGNDVLKSLIVSLFEEDIVSRVAPVKSMKDGT